MSTVFGSAYLTYKETSEFTDQGSFVFKKNELQIKVFHTFLELQ